MGIGYGIARALTEGTTGFMQGRQQAEALRRQRELEDEERRRRAEMDAFNQKYRSRQIALDEAEAADRRAAAQRAIEAGSKRKELWGYATQDDPKAIEELMALGDPNIADFIKEPAPRAPVMGTPEWKTAKKFETDEEIRRDLATRRGPAPEKPMTFTQYFRSQINSGRIDRLRRGDPINEVPGMSEPEIQSLLYNEHNQLQSMEKGNPPPRKATEADLQDALTETGGDVGRAFQLLRQRGFQE